MFKVVLFLHIIGSLALGFYLILPFILGRLGKLSIAAQEGMISAVSSLNRYAQLGLIIQLLTGGYLISKGDYSVLWMVVIVVLFLLIGALSGAMGKPLRLAVEDIRKNKHITPEEGKLRTLSALMSVSVLVVTFFMVYKHII